MNRFIAAVSPQTENFKALSVVQEIVKNTRKKGHETVLQTKRGNYSNVVCVMCTQFIKIFIPRLSLCLFTRSFAVSSFFSALYFFRFLRILETAAEKERPKVNEGRKDMRWKKLSSFRLFLMVSHSSSIYPSISGASAKGRKETNFRGFCCFRNPLLLSSDVGADS